MEIVVIAVQILVSTCFYHGDSWWPRWMAFEITGSCLLAWAISKRYGWLPAIALVLPIIGAIGVFGNMLPGSGPNAEMFGGGAAMAIDDVTLGATVALLLMVVPLAMASVPKLELLETGLGVLCVLSSVMVLIQTARGLPPDDRFGIMNNASINGCFIALTYPFICFRREPSKLKTNWLHLMDLEDALEAVSLVLYIAVPILAIFLEGASVPIGTLGLVFLGETFAAKKSLKVSMFEFLFVLVFLLPLALRFIPNLFSSNGRFELSGYAWSWWIQDGDKWLGSGNGSFFLIGPYLQKLHNFDMGANWIWLHNDWLQLLIECGIFTFAVYVALFVVSLVKSYRQDQSYLFATALGYGAVSLFNFPAHNPLMAFVGVLTVVRIFDKNRVQYLESKSRGGAGLDGLPPS